jgi:hypothetical protein
MAATTTEQKDDMTHNSGDLEAIHQLKARYCRFLDIKDFESWRGVFAPEVTVRLDLAVSVGGRDPRTTPEITGVDQFAPMVFASLEGAATVHHCHTPEITFVSDSAATGIWAMEDHLIYTDGREVHGAGHYHETYEKSGGIWRITSLHLTRTLLRIVGDLASDIPAAKTDRP